MGRLRCVIGKGFQGVDRRTRQTRRVLKAAKELRVALEVLQGDLNLRLCWLMFASYV